MNQMIIQNVRNKNDLMSSCQIKTTQANCLIPAGFCFSVDKFSGDYGIMGFGGSFLNEKFSLNNTG